MGRKPKTLDEHERDGTFRADRHSHLLRQNDSDYDAVRCCLHFGPPGILSGFDEPSADELPAVWQSQKRVLLARWMRFDEPFGCKWDTPADRRGKRPWAFYAFDLGDGGLLQGETVNEFLDRHGCESEAEFLLRHGLLTPAETRAGSVSGTSTAGTGTSN